MKSLISSFFLLVIFYNFLSAQILSVVSISDGQVPQYSKFEVGIQLSQDYTINIANPYDTDKIKIELELTSPRGIKVKRDAFYHTPYTRISNEPFWIESATDHPYRIRFSPDEIGDWTYSVYFYRNGSLVSVSDSYIMNCIPSYKKGSLKVAKNKRYLEFANGESFFGIAEDLRATNNNGPNFFGGHCDTSEGECENWCYSPNTLQNDLRLMTDFKNNGGNMVRVWIEAYSYEFEWEKLGDYSERQYRAHDLDLLIKKAEELDMYIHLVLYNEQHIANQDCSREVACWEDNPYNKELFSEPNSKEEDNRRFFIDKDALTSYKKRLNYIHSRWGYSPAVASYGLINEIDLGPLYWGEEHIRPEIHKWLLNTAEFLKTKSPEKLIGVDWAMALGTSEEVLNSEYIDLVSNHGYEADKNVEYQRNHTAQEKLTKYQKPFTINEFGFRTSCWASVDGDNQDTEEVQIHNTIWSSAFSGAYSNYFYFGSVNKYQNPCWGNDKIKKWIPLSDFFESEIFNERGNEFIPISNAFSYYNSYTPAPLNEPSAYGDLPIIDRSGVADKNQNFSTDFLTKGIATSDERNIQVFGLRNKERVIGWVGNKNHYWYNVFHDVSPKCGDEELGTSYDDFINPNLSSENQSDYEPIIGASMVIDGLFCEGEFRIKWFSTYHTYDIDNDGIDNDGGEIASLSQVVTSNNGRVIVDIPNLQELYIEKPFGPDYGFKLELISDCNVRDEDLKVNVYPNPIGASELVISFGLGSQSAGSFNLYNLNGFMVKQINNGNFIKGRHTVISELADIPSGIYFLECSFDKHKEIIKIIKL